VLSGVFLYAHASSPYVRYVHERAIRSFSDDFDLVWVLACCQSRCCVTLPIVPSVSGLLAAQSIWGFKIDIHEAVRGKNSAVRVVDWFLPWATLLAQNFALGSTEHLALKWRITNANRQLTLNLYLADVCWPGRFSFHFIFTPKIVCRFRILLVSAIILVAITGIAFARRRRKSLHPGRLVLVHRDADSGEVGIIQVGLQGRADRYTYLSANRFIHRRSSG